MVTAIVYGLNPDPAGAKFGCAIVLSAVLMAPAAIGANECCEENGWIATSILAEVGELPPVH